MRKRTWDWERHPIIDRTTERIDTMLLAFAKGLMIIFFLILFAELLYNRIMENLIYIVPIVLTFALAVAVIVHVFYNFSTAIDSYYRKIYKEDIKGYFIHLGIIVALWAILRFTNNYAYTFVSMLSRPVFLAICGIYGVAIVVRIVKKRRYIKEKKAR